MYLLRSNNRYNAIYIDGAVSNDVFDYQLMVLMVVKPSKSISIDAIEQFQAVAPLMLNFLVLLEALCAITRSGTNNFEGSAYFLNRDETLAATPPSLVGADGRKN
jgi:hypothetical protein